MRRLGRAADMNQAAERCVIARDAAGQLEEQRVAISQARIGPGRMLLAQAVRRADERTKSRIGAAGLDHRALAFGGNMALAGAGRDGGDGRRRAAVGNLGGGAQESLLRRGFHQPQIVDRPRQIEPLGIRNQPLQRCRQAMGKAGGPGLDTDPGTRKRVGRQHATDRIGRGFMVAMAFEAGVGHLIGDGDLLHRPGDQHRLVLDRQDQDMRGEVAPVIQTGQVVDVLRRAEEQEIHATIRQDPAHRRQPRLIFGRGEGAVAHRI